MRQRAVNLVLATCFLACLFLLGRECAQASCDKLCRLHHTFIIAGAGSTFCANYDSVDCYWCDPAQSPGNSTGSCLDSRSRVNGWDFCVLTETTIRRRLLDNCVLNCTLVTGGAADATPPESDDDFQPNAYLYICKSESNPGGGGPIGD